MKLRNETPSKGAEKHNSVLASLFPHCAVWSPVDIWNYISKRTPFFRLFFFYLRERLHVLKPTTFWARETLGMKNALVEAGQYKVWKPCQRRSDKLRCRKRLFGANAYYVLTRISKKKKRIHTHAMAMWEILILKNVPRQNQRVYSNFKFESYIRDRAIHYRFLSPELQRIKTDFYTLPLVFYRGHCPI